MDAAAAQALIRFGLGRRGGEAVPGDARAWLAGQLEGPDPALGLPGRTAAEGLVAWREDLKRGNDGIAESRAIYRADTDTWLGHAATTGHGFRERLVWLWANHFTVSLRRGGVVPLANAYVREAIRPHATGRVRDMLGAVVRHPAMLFYLDNAQSVGPGSRFGRRSGRGLNENLARELLELHTVTPAAGYGQADVTALARVLTGWSVALQADPPRALFRPAVHEPGAKTVLGTAYPQGPAALEGVLDALAAHPATLANLARRLVRHFVADEPPAAAVARVARVLAESGGDLKAAALAVVDLPEAWRPLGKLRSPFDYVLAVVRALDLPEGRRPGMRAVLAGLGQGVMNAPLPNGWPDTAAEWSSPEAMMRRIDWAYAVAGRGGGRDPREVAEAALGPLVAEATLREMGRAGSRREALALLFSAPEFQRR